MATNLALDDKLIEQAQKLGCHRSKREAVNTAVEYYIRHLEQQTILDEYGAIDYLPEYDYKRQRNTP